MRGDDLNVININNANVRALIQIEKGEDYVKSLMDQTALPIYQLSNAYTSLKNAINQSVPSASRLHQAIKDNCSVPNFDFVEHHGHSFLDSTCCHL
ncbi:unnamed protein product [Mucor fragilis]